MESLTRPVKDLASGYIDKEVILCRSTLYKLDLI